MDELEWLQSWYLSNCNDLWEHTYGVTIGTLDNPGWNVTIDLRDTRFSALQHESIDVHLSDHSWFTCRIVEQKFEGFGDARKLKHIIATFQEWTDEAGRAK